MTDRQRLQRCTIIFFIIIIIIIILFGDIINKINEATSYRSFVIRIFRSCLLQMVDYWWAVYLHRYDSPTLAFSNDLIELFLLDVCIFIIAFINSLDDGNLEKGLGRENTRIKRRYW